MSINMTTRYIVAALLVIATPIPICRAQTTEQLVPQIVDAARRTAARFKTDAASWTTAIELQDGAALARVDQVSSPNSRSTTISVIAQGQREELARIIERDGLWYVTELDTRYKCRPFEAPLALPSTYHLMGIGDLRIFENIPDPSQLGLYQSVAGGSAFFRTPLPAEKLAQLRALRPLFEEALKSQDADVPAIQKQQAMIEDLINNGVVMEINLEHGYLAASGAPGKRQTVEHFRWLDGDPARYFELEATDWQDRTASLIADPASRMDVAMIGHCRAWQPGAEAYDADVVLLNVKTGAISRVPFQFGIGLPGCFSRDRSKAYLAGVVAAEGSAGLFEIDLLDGVNRQLAAGQLRGLPMFPVLSPDGQTLAVVEAAPGMNAAGSPDNADLLKSQIFLVDVQTGDARPLGEPLDTAFISWLPDASGLLLITRRYESRDKPSSDSLARLNMDGTLTELRPGSRPALVQNGTKIMYEDKDQQKWYTCDLTGENPVLVGDGLSGFGFPAPSPQGDRVLMMRFGQPAGPRPHVVDVRTGHAQPMPVGKGLWTMPVWK
jgi:hypothetical protein